MTQALGEQLLPGATVGCGPASRAPSYVIDPVPERHLDRVATKESRRRHAVRARSARVIRTYESTPPVQYGPVARRTFQWICDDFN